MTSETIANQSDDVWLGKAQPWLKMAERESELFLLNPEDIFVNPER